MKLHGITRKFQSIDSFKKAILDVCKEKVSSLDNFGFIEPGHGTKGKQRWLTSQEDLNDMYATHEGKKEILLWCYQQDRSQKRRANSPDGDTDGQKRSRYDKQLDMMTEVERTLERSMLMDCTQKNSCDRGLT